MLAISVLKTKKSLLISLLIFFTFTAFSFIVDTNKAEAACVIRSAKFSQVGNLSGSQKIPFEQSGNQQEGWFDDEDSPEIRVDVVATDCNGVVTEISITMDDTLTPDDDVGAVDNIKILFPSSSTFTMFFIAGEDECTPLIGTYDCQYFVEIDLPDDILDWTSDGKPGGNLRYECDALCDEYWEIIEGKTIRPEGIQSTDIETDTTYKPLAPIPGLPEVIETSAENNPCAFGKYLNVMLKVVLGIAAVLAFIMIIQGGLQYMTSELMSSKEAGKESITNALTGLVIALSAVFILNTVNPRLLNFCIDNLEEAIIVIANEPETGIGQGNRGEKIELKLKNTSNGVVSLEVCDKSQMQTINIFDKNVEVYKGTVNSLKRIDTKWRAMPEAQRYKINTIAGYDCRTVAGKKAWSAHAYGLALDINASKNPFGKERKTDMPPSFRQLFKDEGWGWGGDWQNVKDAMHYSKYPRSENGDETIEIF